MTDKKIAARIGDARLATTRLIVDIDAVVANYKLLRDKSASARTSAVVKADAYGLGTAQIAPALHAEGCGEFFVANAEEGVALREALPDPEIFILEGCISEEACAVMAEARLIPVLQSLEAIDLWASYWSTRGSRRPCAIMADTGMNRLGLTPAEAIAFGRRNAAEHLVTPILVMSHLACADERSHSFNERQLQSFQRIRAEFKGIESSLANSAGIFLGHDYHFDLTRPGISLYGGAPIEGENNPMRPVATFEAKVLQVRRANAGETVSYGATHTLNRDSIIAVAGVGYADGWHRAGSGSGVPLRNSISKGGFGFINGSPVPAIGRVTMDLAIFDITDLPPQSVKVGDWIELFGPNIPVSEAASAAGTIIYEFLTSSARRAYRSFVLTETSS